MNLDLSSTKTQHLLRLRSAIKEELRKRNYVERAEVSIEQATKSARRYANRGALAPHVLEINSTLLLAMPMSPREQFDEKRVFLQCLLSQDWSHLFLSYEDTPGSFYVYAHVDPRHAGFACEEINILPLQGIPFYVGKGVGSRAYDLKRNQGHGKIIRYLLGQGYTEGSLVRILFSGLSERKAMELEAKLIYFFGTIYEKNRKGLLLNLDLSKRPDFVGIMHRTITKKVGRIVLANPTLRHLMPIAEGSLPACGSEIKEGALT